MRNGRQAERLPCRVKQVQALRPTRYKAGKNAYPTCLPYLMPWRYASLRGML